MLTRKSLLLAAAVVVSGARFAATEVKAQPTDCTAGVYSVHFNGKFPDSTAGTLRWQYAVTSSGPNLQKINDGVMVIPHPVTPNHIQFPAPQNFCEEADSNTKINRGVCTAFAVHLPPVKQGNTVLFDIVTADTVTEGAVTINVVSGSASSNVCVAFVNNEPTGIVGPGATGDPFQPVFRTQDVTVAGGQCIAHLFFDASGKLVDVTTDPPCFEGSADGGLFIGPDEVHNNTGPHGISFGGNTSTCYGPPSPSPPRCVCTKAPCP
ncbi:MAG: hypothetical protein ACREU8_12645 [Gammaproteobacteria bacterium]